jgi:hypothetical protein
MKNVYNLFMRRILAASSLFALVLVGCGGPSLSGDYEVSGGKMPNGAKSTANFSGSNIVIKMELPLPTGGAPLKMDMSGTYTLSGEKLDIDISSAKLDESSVPAALKPMIDANKGQMEGLKSKLTGTVKFEGDVATYTAKDEKGGDASMTFTKAKK